MILRFINNLFRSNKTSSSHIDDRVEPLFAEALAMHQKGQIVQAQALYYKVLKVQPKHFDAIHLLGVIFCQTNNFDHAIELFNQAIALRPNDATIYSNQGNALQHLKQYKAALDSYNMAIGLNPGHAETYNNRGVALNNLKQYEEAIQSYSQAIALNPHDAETYNNRGLALNNLRQHDAAIQDYDQAIAFNPDYAEAYYNRGNTLIELNKYDVAIQSYESAIALKPDYAEAYSNRGNALREIKQLDAAIQSYDFAIRLKPDYAEAYGNLGIAKSDLNQHEVAIQNYDQAIALKPDYAEAYYNRGNALREINQFDAAIQSYDFAIRLRPTYAEAYCNLGIAQSDLNQYEASILSFEQAITIKAGLADAHLNLGFSYLILGNFEQGWEKYESRRQIQQLELHKPKFTQPHWFGVESLKNKTILLYSEQGLGDTIQFCRYVTILSDLGAKIVLQVQKPLARLLTNLSGVSQLIVEGSPLPEFDYHYPLLSLPLAFKTNLTNMPAAPHYLAADATQLKKWQARLGPKTKPRIGIVWSGNESPKNRSIPLIDFVRVLSDEFQFVSLQKEVREVDRQLLQSRHDILHFGNEFLDFADTAALCELVDIVVSIDTSVAHLAGAMGKAVWILLPFKPDWRWFLDRNDNPWYPSAKLYRQKEFGNWGDVLSQVQSDLPQFVCNGCDSNNIEEIAAKPTFPHDSGDK